MIVEGLNLKYDVLGTSADFPGICIGQEQPLLVTTDIRLEAAVAVGCKRPSSDWWTRA